MGKRFVTDFAIPHPEDFFQYVTQDYFAKEGFTYIQYKGENVWKKGTGFLTAPQFIKVTYQNGWVHLEAWMKYAILPGVYCGEMGLTGAWGFAIKDVLRGRVNTLMSLLSQPPLQGAPMQGAPVMQTVPAGEAPTVQTAAATPNMPPVSPGSAPAAGVPAPSMGYAPAPTPVMVHNPTGRANTALIMGLVSLVAWIIPIAGVITSVIGIASAVPGMKSTAKGRAVAGLVLSIVCLVIAIVNWIVGVALQLS